MKFLIFRNYAPLAKCLGVQPDGQFLHVKDAEMEVDVMQGGCTDGTYFYFAIEGSNLKVGETMYGKAHKIFKVDGKTWEIVAVSERLPLDHANSMTYNSKLNRLIVANCNDVVTTDNLDNRKAITFIDPDTLEITEVKYLDIAINAIEYSETYDLYVVGIKGSSAAFAILDSNFVELGYYDGHDIGLQAQDVGCDDNFIYVGNSGIGTDRTAATTCLSCSASRTSSIRRSPSCIRLSVPPSASSATKASTAAFSVWATSANRKPSSHGTESCTSLSTPLPAAECTSWIWIPACWNPDRPISFVNKSNIIGLFNKI